MIATSGIYSITNLIDDKRYIGQSIRMPHRLNHHKSLLRNGHHFNIHLQHAWNKFGESNFKFEVIDECEPELLDSMEKLYISKFEANNPIYGYNLMSGGRLGCVYNDEIKQKISKAKSGDKHHFYGKHYSLKHRIRLSQEQNKSGILNVSKVPAPQCSQGFVWAYLGYNQEEGKQRLFRKKDLKQLEFEAKINNWDWIIIDEEKANISYVENEKFNPLPTGETLYYDVERGISVTKLAEKFNCNRSTIYRRIEKYKKRMGI